MPEWYLVVGVFAVLAALGLYWQPLLLVIPLLLLAVAAPVAQALVSGFKATFIAKPANHNQEINLFLITSFLHLVQPLARLIGRFKHGLTPWRHRGTEFFVLPVSKTVSYWSETWSEASDRLQSLENSLRADGVIVRRNGDFDNGWDLQVRGGMFGGTRLLVLTEEHGQGKQAVRVRAAPRGTFLVHGVVVVLAVLCMFAAFDGAFLTAYIIGLFAALIAARAFIEAGHTTAAVLRAIDKVRVSEKGIILPLEKSTVFPTNHDSLIEKTQVEHGAETTRRL